MFYAMATGRELRRWNGDYSTTHLAYSPDGKFLAQLAGSVIRLRDAVTGKLAVPVSALPDYVVAVRFARDGKSLLTGHYGGGIGSWDPLTGRARASLHGPPEGFVGHADRLLRAALAADGTKAALVDAKGVLHVWDPRSGKICCRISDPLVGEDRADFSPDGRTLVVTHTDKVIRLWDSQTGKLRCALPVSGETHFPRHPVFSPDGRVLACAHGSLAASDIRLWDTATGKERRQLTWKDGTFPTALLFTPDGKGLIAAHNAGDRKRGKEAVAENSLWFWDLATGRVRQHYPISPRSYIQAPALSPDGKTLAAEDNDTVVLWEVASGQERGRFTGHRERIWSLAFSSDGRLLASGSWDHTALVWDVTGVSPDGKLPTRAAVPGELNRLWIDLASDDGVKAHRAGWTLAALGEPAVRFLGGRLRPVAVEHRRLETLIAELDSDRFETRERASQELERLSELAGPALKQALDARPGPEARRRLERLVGKLGGAVGLPEALRRLRAVEALEHLGTSEARRLLARLAGGATEARLTQEAKAADRKLEQPAGKVDS